MSLLAPLGLFTKGIDLGVLNAPIGLYYIIFLILFFLLIYQRNLEISAINNRATKYLILFYLIQMLAIYLESISVKNIYVFREYHVDLLTNIKKFNVFVIYQILYYLLMSLGIQTFADIKKYISGIYLTVIVVITVGYIQLFYLLTHNAILANIINKMASLFEARNKSQIDWYSLGSYTVTLERINIFFEESGFFAAFVLLIIIPFLMSAIKNNYNIFNKTYLSKTSYKIMLLLLLILMILAKTTTGIIGAVLALAFLWLELSKKGKVYSVVTVILSFGIATLLYNNSNYFYEVMNITIFNKLGTGSAINRSAGTLSLIKTWLTHFLIGVGHSNTSFYNFVNVPTYARFNNEYNMFITVHRSYPDMSILFSWLAKYGTIVVGIVLYYIYKIWNDFKCLSYKLNKSDEVDIMYIVIADSGRFFIILFLVISILGFNITFIYYIQFFFFVVFRRIMKKYLCDKGEFIK